MSRHEATLTSKGQITIPAALRYNWGLKDGDKLEFYFDPEGRVLVRPLNAKPTAVFERFGDEIMTSYCDSDHDAIAQAVIEKDDRSKTRGSAT